MGQGIAGIDIIEGGGIEAEAERHILGGRLVTNWIGHSGGVLHRVNGDVDRGHVRIQRPVVELVSEAVGAVPVGIRRVGEAAVRVQDEAAMRGAGNQDRLQRIALGVVIVGLHARRGHVQRTVFIQAVTGPARAVDQIAVVCVGAPVRRHGPAVLVQRPAACETGFGARQGRVHGRGDFGAAACHVPDAHVGDLAVEILAGRVVGAAADA